jgi:hypothetical protein
MGNCQLYKIERFHTVGTPESERLKVTALNLLKLLLKIAELPGEVIIFRIVSHRDTLPVHPTVSPPFQKVVFFHIATQCRKVQDFSTRFEGQGPPMPSPLRI